MFSSWYTNYSPYDELNIDKFKPFYNYCLYLSNYVYYDNDNIISNKEYDTQLLITINNNSLYICFRGSSSLKDWIVNLDLNLTKCTKNNKSYKIHNGFNNQYTSVKNDIINKISHLLNIYNINNIVITGHSLGGAIATVCSLDLIDNPLLFNKTVYCVTFGCPRVGNKDFINLYNSYDIKTHRIVTKGDPIVKLPFNGNYRHVCSSIYLCDDKVFSKKVEIYSAFKRFYKNIFKIDYTAMAHLITRYKKLLTINY